MTKKPADKEYKACRASAQRMANASGRDFIMHDAYGLWTAEQRFEIIRPCSAIKKVGGV